MVPAFRCATTAVTDATRMLACAVPIARAVAPASSRPMIVKTSSRIGTAMTPPPTPRKPASRPINRPVPSNKTQTTGG